MGKNISTSDKATIRALADLLDEKHLHELEFEREGLRIRVARTPPLDGAVLSAPMAPAPAIESATPAARADSGTEHPGAVRSPMVGTIYHSPEPGAPPFIEVGQTVEKDDTLLVVEAMKTFNAIPAPRAGKVMAILVDDGQPVEFDEPLVVIE